MKRLRIANKLNKALGKNAMHARVVMIEINVPEVVTSFDGWPAAAMQQIRFNEKTDFPAEEGQALTSSLPITPSTTISPCRMLGCNYWPTGFPYPGFWA